MKLEVKNISVSLSNKEILNSINLKVEDGELISLLGASGCGKSTLLKTIAGIIKQDKGSIFLNGNLADNTPPHKRKTVIVFQDFRLFPHMSVAENVSFPLKMIGLNKHKCRIEAMKLLKKVKLEGFEDRNVNNISGGQMQRVALARAIAAKPTVLLLDEPFSSLDLNLREDMRDLVLQLQNEYAITTILVTHDQKEALTMSERIAFMSKGNIEQYDSPEKIYKNPINEIVADYFSTGLYTHGRIINNNFTSDLFSFKTRQQNGDYKCLIRPYAVNLEKDENSNFIVNDKIYQGDNYLIKINHINKNLNLESVAPVSCNIEVGDKVNIELEKDKLVFIPK